MSTASRAALLGCLTMLASCVAPTPATRPPVPKYDPPSSPTVSRLVIRGVVPSGDAYRVSALDDSEHCDRPRLIGSGNSVQHPDSTTLAAGEQTTLEFHLVKPNNQGCISRWTFTPVAGKSYLLMGIGLPTGCVALVNDMSDVDHIKPDPTALHRNPSGASSCVPIAQSRALPIAASASAASAGEAVLRDGATTTDLQGLIAP